MSTVQNLLESIDLGPIEIDANIKLVHEAILIAGGDKESGSQYAISYNNISSNPAIAAVMDEIVSKVDWSKNASLRNVDASHESTLRQCVYYIACIIKPLAIALRDMVKQTHDQQAYAGMSELVKFQSSIHKGLTLTQLTEIGYASWIAAIEVCTATRHQTSIDEDYGAQAELNELWNGIYLKFKDVREIVLEVLHAANVSMNENSPSIDTAAQWLLLWNVLKYDIFGANQKGASWYNPGDSLTVMMYKYTKYMLSNTDQARQLKKDSDTQYILDENHIVVKDMANLGKNDSQLTILNEDTDFTCYCYYKIYAIDGLSKYSFEDPIGRLVYRIVAAVSNHVGLTSVKLPNSKDSAAKLAADIKQKFASFATSSTAKALRLRLALIEALESFEDKIPGDANEFGNWFMDLNGQSNPNARDNLKQAIQAIRRDILYVGSSQVNGQTMNHESVAATMLASPVVTIGHADVTDRNKSDDLNEAGKLTSSCFKFKDNELQIVYDPSSMKSLGADSMVSSVVPEGAYQIDTIQSADIPKVYDNYVSSVLVPASVSRSQAWIMFFGIQAFSFLNHGNLDDSVDVSPVTASSLKALGDARLMQNTKISMDARQADIINNKDFVKGLVKYNFMSPDTANVFKKRMDALDQLKTSVPDSVVNSLTKIRGVCDAYTKAVNHFAHTYCKNNPDRISDVRQYIYAITPSIGLILNGKRDTINQIVTTYVAKNDSTSSDKVASADILTSVVVAYTSMQNASHEDSVEVRRLVTTSYLTKLYTAISTFGEKMADTSAMASEIAKQLHKCLPENSDNIHKILVDCDNELKSAGSKKLKKAIREKYAEAITESMTSLLEAGSHVMPSIAMMSNGLVNNVIDSATGIDNEAVRQLKNDLDTVVKYIDTHSVTNDMLDEVINVMAEHMEGDPAANVDALDNLKMSQFVLRVKQFRMMMTAIGKSAAQDTDVADDLADLHQSSIFDFDKGGTESMDELNPFNQNNLGNAYLKTTRLTDENAVDSPAVGHGSTDAVDFLEKIRDAVYQWSEADERSNEAKAELYEIEEFAKKFPSYQEIDVNSFPKGTDDQKWNQRMKQIIDNMESDENISSAIISHAKNCLREKTEADGVTNVNSTLLDSYAKNNPSFSGMIKALLDVRISATELDRTIRYLDAATNVRDSLIKYRSYSAANAEDAGDLRWYAYTDSDESAIAQIMCVLGTYIAAPHNYELNDLIDSLTQIESFIKKYSQNPLSVKVIGKVIDKLKDVESYKPNDVPDTHYSKQMSIYYADVSAAIVKLINQLGGFLLSRDQNDMNSRYLENTKPLARPNTDPEYGNATDSFARSQLRAKMHDKVKTVGGRDEQVARKSYINLLKNDLSKNTELAKLAFVLGSAFNAYDQMLTDERVNDVNNRSLNSVEDSLKGVELFKGRGSNDLQRELVSAIIDDERANDKNYPTVKEVVNAALTRGHIMAYGQMYSDQVKNTKNILHDSKNTVVAFDEQGNRTDPQNAVALTRQAITALATQVGDSKSKDSQQAEAERVKNVIPFNDVTDLVHDIRMCIFEKLYRDYGSVADDGTVSVNSYYSKKASEQMKVAMRTMYDLCDDMDTPIADIILVSSSVGQKIGRLSVMKYVKDQLIDNGDLDLDVAGMISNEPDAYPQAMSDEVSTADTDWINGVTELLSLIPDDLTKEQVIRAVDLYNGSDLSRQELAKHDETRELLRVIDGLLRLDTSTGVPTGFWGEDSTDRKQQIEKIFNLLCHFKTDDNDWDDCAGKLRELFANEMDKSKGKLALNKSTPSNAALRKIYHRRLNPYYSTKFNSNPAAYQSVVDQLESAGIIKDYGRIVKLKYPGMSFDVKTFKYIVSVALTLGHQITAKTVTDLFLMTLMFVLNGMRPERYLALKKDVAPLYERHDDIVSEARQVINQSDRVKPEVHDELIKTKLGWLTPEAYNVMCAAAISTKFEKDANESTADRLVSAFIETFETLTQGGNTTFDVSDMHRPVADDKTADTENEVVPNGDDTGTAVTGTTEEDMSTEESSPEASNGGDAEEYDYSNTVDVSDGDDDYVVEVNSNVNPDTYYQQHVTDAKEPKGTKQPKQPKTPKEPKLKAADKPKGELSLMDQLFSGKAPSLRRGHSTAKKATATNNADLIDDDSLVM